MPAAAPKPWIQRLEQLELQRELDVEEREAARANARAWAMTTVGLIVTVLLALGGSVVAGAIAYGELKAGVSHTAEDVREIREDLRVLR